MALIDTLERQLKTVQNPSPVFAAPKSGENAPTDKQVSYFKALVEKKQLAPEVQVELAKALAVLDRRTITSTISWLIGLPWKPTPKPAPAPVAPRPVIQPTAIAKIGEGRYAVTDPTDGDLRFYEVRKPKEGKWAGFVFLSRLSGENHIPMRDRNERDVIYNLIAKDVIGSLKLYGQKIGRCGHCSKQLTDAVSREFGIGPVCRKSLGL